MPAGIAKALKTLATAKEVRRVMIELEEVIRLSDDVPLNLLEPFSAFASANNDWTSGVEHYQSTSADALLEMLGRQSSDSPMVPGFNRFLDRTKEHDPWDKEERKWFRRDSVDRLPLRLRWHQLVGVVRMLDQFFTPPGEAFSDHKAPAILLMDEVGLGKTLQVAAVMAFIIYFRSYYEKNGRFPGKYGEVPTSLRLLNFVDIASSGAQVDGTGREYP